MGEANASGAPAVRVVAVSRVVPAPVTAERQAERVKLSMFDSVWATLPPIQRLFLYDLPSSGGHEGFPAVVERLKASLASTLALYLPLAGKLAYLADTADVVVDCAAADAGVAFVEADADGTMDVRRLAGDEAHDIPAFLALVPDLDAKALPAPVLSVQATLLVGGLALGVSVHHAVVDGQALVRFMAAWAAAAREGSPVTETLRPPHFDREAAIRIPDHDEVARHILRKVAPNLPVIIGTGIPVIDLSQRFRLARRTFYFASGDIRALKHHINEVAAAGNSNINNTTSRKPVSTFVALAALGWTAFARSKGLAVGDDTHLLFQADLRARLDPPVRDGYLGNCIKSCLVTTDAGDLLSEQGLVHAARAIQAVVAELEAEVVALQAAPQAERERWMERVRRLPPARLANMTASPRFRVYEGADFGFGQPVRVQPVSMNRDGEMTLFGGRRDGEVQLSVSLDPVSMDEFKAQVLSGLAVAR